MGQQIKIERVRLSYPKLAKAEPYEEGGDPRFSANFLVPKGSKVDKQIEAAILAVATEEFKDKGAAFVKAFRMNANKFCYRDGDSKPNANGYAEHNFLAAIRSEERDGRPLIVDRRGRPVNVGDPGYPYAGCYVNAIVDIWAQSGANGGIRCTLLGVQFVEDGESFGGAATLDPSAFGDLGDIGGGGGSMDDGLDAETRAMLGL